MYEGLCLDGPRGGQYVTHAHDVMRASVRRPLPPAQFAENVAVFAKTEVFEYHAVQIVSGAQEPAKFWIPREWFVQGQSAYTMLIVQFLAEQYAR
jgi:hypothetical protein